MKIKAYVKLIRTKHYLKNLLIFLPVVFGRELFNINVMLKVIIGFIIFSCVASLVYVINDICDLEKDKIHPLKCKRPLASGEVSLLEAKSIMGVLVLIAIVGSGYLSMVTNIGAFVLPFVYLGLNVLYSKGLKNIPIVDVVILSIGFFIRVIYGAILSDIALSQWLYLTIISFSLCLGLGKRRNELVKNDKKDTRTVLEYYNYNFLDKNLYMCMGLGIVFYALWTIDTTTIQRFGNNFFSWTIPIVIVILLRYNLIIEGDNFGDPVEVLLSDKVLMGLCVFYAIITISLVYL